MGQSKFLKGIVIGAITGAAISLLDKTTRESVCTKTKKTASDIRFYVKNREILINKVQEQADRLQELYGQISADAAFVSEKVDEIKTLTPHVKDIVTETKDTFITSKEEYKTIGKSEQQ